MQEIPLTAVFSEAYELHNDAIFRHCLYRVRSRQVALDLMQETFAKTWHHLADGGEVTHMKSFLYTVANHLIIDRSRKHHEASLDMMTETGFDPGENDPQLGRDVIASAQAIKLLDTLSSKHREAIVMRYIDDLKPQEIAEILGESANVISVRIHAGLKALRAHYPEESHKELPKTS